MAHWLAEGQLDKWLLMCTGCKKKKAAYLLSQYKRIHIHFYISIWFRLRFPAEQLDMHSIKQQHGKNPPQIHHNLQCSCPSFAACFFFLFHILCPDAAVGQRTRSPAVAALQGSLGRTVKLNDSASSARHGSTLRLLGRRLFHGTDRFTEWQAHYKYAIMKLMKYLMTSVFLHLLPDRWDVLLWEIRLEVTGNAAIIMIRS